MCQISESIAEKNEQILSSLSEFRDQFIFHDDPSQNDLIFPVDNLCWWKRSKTSALIRERIISQKDVGFKVPIPVKWYMFRSLPERRSRGVGAWSSLNGEVSSDWRVAEYES